MSGHGTARVPFFAEVLYASADWAGMHSRFSPLSFHDRLSLPLEGGVRMEIFRRSCPYKNWRAANAAKPPKRSEATMVIDWSWATMGIIILLTLTHYWVWGAGKMYYLKMSLNAALISAPIEIVRATITELNQEVLRREAGKATDK